MNKDTQDKLSLALMALVALPPLIAAMAAGPLIMIWIMGLSAFSGTERAFAANLGLWALIIYLPVYVVLVAGVALSMAMKWPLTGLFHTLIWMCFLALTGVTVWSFSELGVI